MRTLYLGLRPKAGTYHYPVIRTEKLEYAAPLAVWPEVTHLIFTSQEAVSYWDGPWDKEVIAIGESTAGAAMRRGCQPLIAPAATQEGVMALVDALRGVFCWPKSQLARSALVDHCRLQRIRLYPIDLYTTILQHLKPEPDLSLFDEIVFTSPSTVEGFIQIFGALPQDKRLTAIGPVTQEAINLRQNHLHHRMQGRLPSHRC
jgi:uroporphyrinogen-III synthase